MTYLNNALVSLMFKPWGAYSVTFQLVIGRVKSGRYFNIQESPQLPTSTSIRQFYTCTRTFSKITFTKKRPALFKVLKLLYLNKGSFVGNFPLNLNIEDRVIKNIAL